MKCSFKLGTSLAAELRFDSGFFPKSDAVYLRFSMILQNTLYGIYIVMIKSNLFPIKFLLVYQDSIVSTPWLLKSSVEVVYIIEPQLMCIVRKTPSVQP